MPPEAVTDVFSGTAVQAAEDGCSPGARSAGLCREPQTEQEINCSLVSGHGGSEPASPPCSLPETLPLSLLLPLQARPAKPAPHLASV